MARRSNEAGADAATHEYNGTSATPHLVARELLIHHTSLRLAIHQINPELCEPDRNLARIGNECASHPEAGLHLFPELALTGYEMGTRSGEFAIAEGDSPPLPVGSPGTVVFGFPFRGRDGRLFNAAGAVRSGVWQTIYRKVYLPTYGMFDEGRYFAPGRRAPELFEVDGFRVAIAVCEDLWHPAVAWLAAMQGADLLVCPIAAAGRGFRAPTEGAFESWESWVAMARGTAIQHGMAVAVCNRVGIEGGITFAGGSFMVSPAGEVTARAGEGEEVTLSVTLSREEIHSARRPFSHLRDDDPHWVRREIERLGLVSDDNA